MTIEDDTLRRLPEVQQFTEASHSLNRCSCCNGRAVMIYTPGCTYIHCIKKSKTMMALPDWCPLELRDKWNEENPKQ